MNLFTKQSESTTASAIRTGTSIGIKIGININLPHRPRGKPKDGLGRFVLDDTFSSMSTTSTHGARTTKAVTQ
jgi:hypothetical protein